jgi:hypothetical protein
MTQRAFQRTRVQLGIAAAILATMGGCKDSPLEPQTAGQRPVGRVAFFADAGATGVDGLVIAVTGAGIVKSDGTTPDTLLFNLSLSGGVASGSLVIPAGTARHIVVHAYTGVMETHRGEATTDISTGTNPTIELTLFPLTGSVPITLTIGTTLVLVGPDSVYVGLGDTLRMTAQVRDQNNAVQNVGVVWASLNTARATVDKAGLVTVRDTGYVQIIATQGGAAGSGRIYG